MATALSPAIAAALQVLRSNPQGAGTPMTGTVSELQAGDFLHGNRSMVTVAGATTGTAPNQVRALTLTRLGLTLSVSWPATQTIYFER